MSVLALLYYRARYVGHMEQHSGAQEAAGLSAGEAAAAAERPRTTVRRYVQTGERPPADQQLFLSEVVILALINLFIIESLNCSEQIKMHVCSFVFYPRP